MGGRAVPIECCMWSSHAMVCIAVHVLHSQMIEVEAVIFLVSKLTSVLRGVSRASQILILPRADGIKMPQYRPTSGQCLVEKAWAHQHFHPFGRAPNGSERAWPDEHRVREVTRFVRLAAKEAGF